MTTIMPTLTTSRTQLILPDVQHASLIRDYYLENKDHLAPWEPERTHRFYSTRFWQQQIKDRIKSTEDKTALQFIAIHPLKKEIIGTCNFSGITFGAFQACYLGYSVARRYEGQGFICEKLSKQT